jgi:hypothetical protein
MYVLLKSRIKSEWHQSSFFNPRLRIQIAASGEIKGMSWCTRIDNRNC